MPYHRWQERKVIMKGVVISVKFYRAQKGWVIMAMWLADRKRSLTFDSVLWINQWSESEVKSLSRVWLFAIPWTVVYQASLSMGFSRQEYWSGLPFPSPGDLPVPGIEPRSPALQADALPSEPPGILNVVLFNLFMVMSFNWNFFKFDKVKTSPVKTSYY